MPILGSGRDVTALFVNRHWFYSEAVKSPKRRTSDVDYVNLRLFIIEKRLERIMAKAKQETKKSTGKVTWQGYRNVNIPASHVEECETYLSNSNQVWQDYLQALNDGYSIKQYFDAKDESYKCVLNCQNADSPNAGYAMAAFGGDWFSALGAVLYKHFVVSDEDWSSVDIGEKRSFG